MKEYQQPTRTAQTVRPYRSDSSQLASTKPGPVQNYEHGIRRELVANGPVIDQAKTTILINVGDGRGGQVGPGKELRSVIASGPFAGRSEREVAREAYDWWESYLSEIDMLASES